ncbi:hypothetical protein OR221_0048 [Microbacterium laevaniformans OR221]|nr:hypothetical protein OR221_0048 [Microbacterium laevaniformans OR221]
MTVPLIPEPAPMPSPLAPLPIDVLDPGSDAVRHAGRSAVRRATLEMQPVSSAHLLLPGPLGRAGGPMGVFWALRAANDLHVALRTASFPSAHHARQDAVSLLSRADELEEVTVGNADGTRYSCWYTLSGRVVLVAGHAWRRPSTSNGRALREIIARLPRLD